MTPERFLQDVRRNSHVAFLLDHWDELALPQGWLVAGCLFQTVWNLQAGRDPHEGIKDYDLFCFDAQDLGAEAEAAHQRRVQALVAGRGIEVEVCNQARVHHWYEAHFGRPCPPLRSAEDGIGRFLVSATCVGVRPGEVHAPCGLADLYEGRLGKNARTPWHELYVAKAASYRRRWPWLQCVDAADEVEAARLAA